MVRVLVPTRGWLRLLRGSTVALVSTVLATLGHATAGGATAGMGNLAVLGVLMAVLMTALADRRPRPTSLFATVGGSQILLHLLLQAMDAHVPGTHLDAVHPVPMVAVHVVATGVAAFLLVRADDLIFLIASVLARITPGRLRPPPTPDPLSAPLPGPGVTTTLRSFLYALVVGQRGPPVPE